MGHRRQVPVKPTIVLPVEGCWELEEGAISSTLLFQALASEFPEVTSVFIEGTSIDPEVKELLVRFAGVGSYLPKTQTTWPVPLRFHCASTPEFWTALVDVSKRYAEPELFDHLFLYSGDRPIIEWPDAFYNCMWVASVVSEDRMKAFAATFGLRYRRVNEAQQSAAHIYSGNAGLHKRRSAQPAALLDRL